MLPILGNVALRGIKEARRVLEDVGRQLPPTWRLKVEAARRDEDAVVEVQAPDGTAARFLVQVKSAIEPADVARLLPADSKSPQLVVAPFLSRRTQELLADRGIGYADATGNMRLTSDRPALHLSRQGAQKNPSRTDPRSRTLKGPKAASIVHNLIDFGTPMGIRRLAARVRVNPGYASRVVDLLRRDALVERTKHGPITKVDWKALIRRLAEDYSVFDSNVSESFLEPRGLPAFLDRLRKSQLDYRLTGSVAASLFAPIASSKMAMIYVDDILEAASLLGLRPAETGANVILLEPPDPAVFRYNYDQDGLTLAGLSHITVDLLTGPGRGPAEAEQLLEWMERHQDEWRGEGERDD